MTKQVNDAHVPSNIRFQLGQTEKALINDLPLLTPAKKVTGLWAIFQPFIIYFAERKQNKQILKDLGNGDVNIEKIKKVFHKLKDAKQTGINSEKIDTLYLSFAAKLRSIGNCLDTNNESSLVERNYGKFLVKLGTVKND